MAFMAYPEGFVYLAYETACVSRMTVILTWPGFTLSSPNKNPSLCQREGQGREFGYCLMAYPERFLYLA